MYELLSSYEARAQYNKTEKPSRERAFARAVFDSWPNEWSKDVPLQMKTMNRLSSELGEYNTSAKYFKPLGDFKDLFDPDDILHGEIDRLDVYRIWRGMFEHVYPNGESYVTIAVAAAMEAKHLMRLHAPAYTPELYLSGLSQHLWHMTEGVMLELETIRELHRRLSPYGIKVYAAPGRDESQDVDAYASKNGIKMAISIKSGRGMSRKTVDIYRNKKKKTRPDMYVGYDQDGVFRSIPPEEGGMKMGELLRAKGFLD